MSELMCNVNGGKNHWHTATLYNLWLCIERTIDILTDGQTEMLPKQHVVPKSKTEVQH